MHAGCANAERGAENIYSSKQDNGTEGDDTTRKLRDEKSQIVGKTIRNQGPTDRHTCHERPDQHKARQGREHSTHSHVGCTAHREHTPQLCPHETGQQRRNCGKEKAQKDAGACCRGQLTGQDENAGSNHHAHNSADRTPEANRPLQCS